MELESQNFISTRYTKIKSVRARKKEERWQEIKGSSLDEAVEKTRLSKSLKEKISEKIKPNILILPTEKKYFVLGGNTEIKRHYDLYEFEKRRSSFPPPEKQKELSEFFVAKQILKEEDEVLVVNAEGKIKIAIISDQENLISDEQKQKIDGEETEQVITLSKVLVNVKEGSDVEIADIRNEYFGWLVSSLNFNIHDNSQVKYILIDTTGRDFSIYEEKTFLLGKNAKMVGGNIWNGEGFGVFFIKSELSGERAEIEDNHICIGRGKRHLEVDYFLEHNEKRTKGHLITRGVLFDSSWVIFLEDAKIRKNATGSDSYVEGKSILFSDKVKSYLMPSMEIDTNDVVQAKHSASMGKIGEKELFYVMSRGLTEDEAKILIVEGFLDEVFQKFPKISWIDWEKISPRHLFLSREILL